MAGRIKNFGRTIFNLYERRPLLMNSFAGGIVYVSSEVIVQVQQKPINKTATDALDVPKVVEIGTLGVLENGVFMLTWYNLLNRYVGSINHCHQYYHHKYHNHHHQYYHHNHHNHHNYNHHHHHHHNHHHHHHNHNHHHHHHHHHHNEGSGVTTSIVLFKCFLDQVFFATQQDAIFLGICALNNDPNKLQQAIEYVKTTFLTTWIMDCSLWPIVNFIGFSAIPIQLQPTYMAFIQFGWQLYMSSIASMTQQEMSDDDIELARIFDQIDNDKNGYLDKFELSRALALRGIITKEEDIIKMIEEGDSDEEHDGRISFDEFKNIAKNEKNSHLWNTLTKKNILSKGIRATYTKVHQLSLKKNDTSSNDVDPLIIQKRKERSDAIRNATMSFSLLFSCALLRKLIFKI